MTTTQTDNTDLDIAIATATQYDMTPMATLADFAYSFATVNAEGDDDVDRYAVAVARAVKSRWDRVNVDSLVEIACEVTID